MTDEASQAYPATINTLLDNALGPHGYYGAFGANMHTDDPSPHAGAEAIVASAQARSVPVISYKQLLEWVDGRNNSTIRGLTGTPARLTFITTVAAGATASRRCSPCRAVRHADRAHLRRLPAPTRSRRSRASSTRCSTRSPGTCQATYS